MKENQSIRDAARIANIPLWKVADAIGVSEPTFMRWMRFPLPDDKEKKIMDAIKELEAK